MGGHSHIGRRIPRVDGKEIAFGDARYTVDVALPGMLYGKILRSPFPHAKVRSVNVEKARRLKGVVAVVTGADTLGKPFGYGTLANPDEYALPVDRVRYIGEQVAAVAAWDEDIAEEALGLIEVDYEELSAVFDPREAMSGTAPVIHDYAPDNVSNRVDYHWGDVDEAFAKCEYIREDTFVTQAQTSRHLAPPRHS